MDMELQKLLKRKKRAVTENNKQSIAIISNELGNWYNTHGKYEEALEEYKSEAEIYDSLGMQMEFGKAHRMMGEMSMLTSDFSEALKHAEIHLNTARDLSNKIEEQRALATIGRIHLLHGQSITETVTCVQELKSAEKAFMKSLLLCESLKGKIPHHELMDMRARLLLNLGVVLEHLENFERSIEFIEKAISICQKQELYELLHQCYMTEGLLFYNRQQDYTKALGYFNKALEVAERLPDKIVHLCESLSAKAEVFVSQNDLQSAKQVLIKAWKLKNPDENEYKIIEKKLKIVACMCYTEDSLISVNVTHYEAKKKLYEKLADGYCFFKKYSKAITYYLLMLQCAQLNNEKEKDLIPIYVSLYQTYRDNRQYDLALDYYWKEYNLCSDIPKEAFNTLISISEVLELAQKKYEVIEPVYIKARQQARKTGRLSLEILCLQKLINLQKANHKLYEAEIFQKEVMDLKNNCANSDSSSDEESDVLSENVPDIGDDICIEDLSDVSDSDASDNIDRIHNTRKRDRSLIVKRNSKGETQLHLACISGNIVLVKRLLDHNHPVNIRDNAGWLPLHEACLYGFKEIVEMLLDNGASINDRGGTKCDGITPLYDAASNGHLEVIELLLNYGASAKLLTDEGESALDILLKWKENAELNEMENIFYESIYSKLKKATMKSCDDRIFDNANFPKNDISNGKELDILTKIKENNSKQLSKPSIVETSIGRLRFHSDNFHDIENNSVSSDKNKKLQSTINEKRYIGTLQNCNLDKHDDEIENNARLEYQNVMKNLRTRNCGDTEDNFTVDKKKKRSALLDINEVGDDWLEDDLLHRKSKRRKGALKHFEFSAGSIAKPNQQQSYAAEKTSNYENLNASHSIEIISDQIHINKSTLNNSMKSLSYKSNTKKKRKRQSSLLESGFSRESSMSPTFDNIVEKSGSHQIEPDSTTEHQSPLLMQCGISNQSNILSVVPPIPVKVRVEDRLLVVPIVANLIDSLNIAWLSKETSKRYYNIVGLEPSISLMTPDGALLTPDDPLSLVLGVSELQSQVLMWNLPPLHERYVEACGHLNLVVDDYLQKSLNACQATQILDVDDLSLSASQLQPVFRSLNHQANLQVLNVSNNVLTDEGVKSLCISLPTLLQLKVLDLSVNNLTYNSISFMSDLLERKPCLKSLEELNIGFNPLGDKCWKYLNIILEILSIHTLVIPSCDLEGHHQYLTYNINKLKHIDIGFNDFDGSCFSKLISSLNGDLIEIINLENIRYTESNFTKVLVNFLANSSLRSLKKINLAGCRITDSDLVEILRPLLKAEKFKFFNLANNYDLSSISLRRLIQHRPCIKNISLEGCINIIKYLAVSNVYDDNDHIAPETIKLSIDTSTQENRLKLDIIVNLWKKLWADDAIVKYGPFGLIDLIRK